MNVNRLTGGLFWVSEWIVRLAYLNLLWVVFTLMGLVVLGFFPATTAMFAICRKWLSGEEDISIFKIFMKVYRKKFIKSNVIGLILTLITFVLYFDIQFFQSFQHFIFEVLTIISFIMLFIIFIASLYLFPSIVHYRFTLFDYLKNCLIFSIGRPLHTIIMLSGVFSIFFILVHIPGLIPLFGGSSVSLLLMCVAMRVFSKVKTESIETKV